LQEIFAITEPTGPASLTPIAQSSLRFVSDSATKSILVFGARPSELRQIEQLVELYDRPAESLDPDTVRKPRYFQLQHVAANVIADVLKAVYRDVLSPNDDALRVNRRNSDRDSPPPPVTYYDVAPDGTDQKLPRYKGMLSIGVFEQANALVVSAPKFLQDEIERTIESLDRPAASNVTEAISLRGGLSGSYVAGELAKILQTRAEPRPAARPGDEQREPREPAFGDRNGSSESEGRMDRARSRNDSRNNSRTREN
jgi:hypothetical protein